METRLAIYSFHKCRARVMFTGYMVNAWIVATMVAIVAGTIGFFVVLRGEAFMAHAVPQSGFAGAAAATLVGVSTVWGLGIAAAASAVGIWLLGRRGRHDVATALALVTALALGALFLSFTTGYASEIFGLLFGEVLGVSSNDIGLTALLSVLSLGALAILYRPLLLTSVLPESGSVTGVASVWVELSFLLVVALATTMSVPVVGALLMFSLMIGPPAAATSLAGRPSTALALSIALALLTVWASIAVSYESNWPVGFFVGVFGAGVYLLARSWATFRSQRFGRRRAEVAPASGVR